MLQLKYGNVKSKNFRGTPRPDSDFKGECRERWGWCRKFCHSCNIGFLFGPNSDQNTISIRFLTTQCVTDERIVRQLYYDKDDLDDACIRACIGLKSYVPKREQRALLDESYNSKPVLRNQIMVCAGVHLVPVWAQFFLFLLFLIFLRNKRHICVYIS